jgi:hypothetical protein
MCILLLATAVAVCQTDPSQTQPEIDRVQSLQRASEAGPGTQPGSRDAEPYPQRGSDNDEWILRVYVWSSATPADTEPKEAGPATLSRSFAVAALNAATRLQFTERSIANSIKMGSLLDEFWIHTDLDSIDDSLRLAALSATNKADRQALQQLETQSQRLRLWSDWMIEQKREMRLGDYYTYASRLDDDERFQNTVTCTNFLMSMLASGKLAEDNSCL